MPAIILPRRLRLAPLRSAFLPALLAWLLLTLQLPWHAGMSAAHAVAGATPDIAALGLRCGPAPDAQTLAALVESGLLPPAPAPDAGQTCDLFNAIAAAVAATGAPQAATPTPGEAPVTFAPNAVPTRADWQRPPTRAPPSLS